MSEQKHTPAPWSIIIPPASCLTTRFIEGPNGEHICKIGHRENTSGSQESDLANASLIAAAPELLAACKAVLERKDWPVGTMKIKAQLKAAILKATGN